MLELKKKLRSELVPTLPFKDKETQGKDFNFCPTLTHRKRIEKKMKRAF